MLARSSGLAAGVLKNVDNKKVNINDDEEQEELPDCWLKPGVRIGGRHTFLVHSIYCKYIYTLWEKTTDKHRDGRSAVYKGHVYNVFLFSLIHVFFHTASLFIFAWAGWLHRQLPFFHQFVLNEFLSSFSLRYIAHTGPPRTVEIR